MKTLSDIFTSLQLSQRDAQLLLDKLQDYDSAGAPNSVHQVYAEEKKRIKDVHGLFTKAIDHLTLPTDREGEPMLVLPPSGDSN